jgi:hypothetical protein
MYMGVLEMAVIFLFIAAEVGAHRRCRTDIPSKVDKFSVIRYHLLDIRIEVVVPIHETGPEHQIRCSYPLSIGMVDPRRLGTKLSPIGFRGTLIRTERTRCQYEEGCFEAVRKTNVRKGTCMG